MGVQEDKIQKLLDTYTKKKNWNAKGWVKIVKDNLSKEQYKKLLAQKPPPFKHFHRSWTKKRIMDIPMWKGDTWDQVIEFCKLTKIKPKEVMNWAAGRKINKTNWKTIQISMLFYSSPSKLSVRGKAINLSKKIIEIDSSMKQGPSEEDKHWHQRLYLRVHNALGRVDAEDFID